MALIYQLPLLSQASPGDQLAVYAPNTGDARRLPMSALLQFFQQQFASPTTSVSVYIPTTGFVILLPDPVSQQQWVILQPTGLVANGQITLPLNTTTPDGTEILFNTTQQITAFTLNANGASALYGAPGTLAADDFFRMKYYKPTNSWYRIV
jgi:hypothetical protein